MKKTEQLYHELRKRRLVALLSPENPEDCVSAYERCRQSGFILEVALRSDSALAGLNLLFQRHPDALVLAGTVMTERQASEALEAGVSGIVSADFVPEVVSLCTERDIMCIPGGLSDAGKQLALKAEACHCTLEELRTTRPYQWIYKLFPVEAGRQSYLELPRAWRGPYPELTVMYAGGVSLNNAGAIAAADPASILCASALAKGLGDDETAKWKAAISPGRPSPAKSGTVADGKSNRIVTFGELMLRLSPPAGVRLGQARSFDVQFGGAEANVAVSLARLGLDAAFVSALPGNELGENARATLRGHGVDTCHVSRQGPRIGIYYLEHGAGPRPSSVVYDRLPSSFSGVEAGTFDWESILDGAVWFHWTGITPALGDQVAASLRSALEVAKGMGLTVSADLNFRRKLWSRDKACEIMTGLMGYVDILFANEEDPAAVFGIEPADTDVSSGNLCREAYGPVAERLLKTFSFSKVAITLRESISASENRWSAGLHDGNAFHLSPVHRLQIVDRVGAGDAFAAGLIYGLHSGKPDPEALDFAVAASCLKHSIAGDFNLVSVAEIERLAAGKSGGRIQR